MKKIFIVLLLIGSVAFTSCIKELSERGVYEITRCYGVVVDSLTEQPIANVRVVTTDMVSFDDTVFSKADGTFEIPVRVSKLTSDYYVCFSKDSIFRNYSIKVSDLALGTESYDLGKILFEGAFVPIVYMDEPQNITTTSARCEGFIEDNGYAAITDRGFVYSTMQYPTLKDQVIQVGDGNGNFNADFTLLPNTTYYVRAYAINLVGVGYSNQVEITTLSGLPVVTTDGLTEITATTAMGGGHISADGGFPVTSRGVCWSTSSNPTIANTHVAKGSDTGSFTIKLSGLHPGTVYYARAYAQNEVGISYGSNMVFTTTSGLPSVTTATAANITATTADAGGEVSTDGGFPVIRRGVCYSTSPEPTLANAHTTDGTGVGSFVSQMANLTSGTRYYFRAYATNGVGTVYGDQHTFVTE